MNDSFLRDYFGLDELLGVNRKGLKPMVLKKDDLIFMMVPKEYTENTGINKLEGFHAGSSTDVGGFDVLIGTYIEYDQIGLWVNTNIEGERSDVMIPLHIIAFILVNPSKKTQKKMGYEI